MKLPRRFQALRLIVLLLGLSLLSAGPFSPALFAAEGVGGGGGDGGGGDGGGGDGGGGDGGEPGYDPWVPYGFAIPGDPNYGFGLPDNNTKNSLGLAAKGNIVVGDYTSADFKTYVLPLLQPNTGKTQPYAIDPTDADLGYFSYALGGNQIFNGDYTKVDEAGSGKKLDGSARRFYESTLSDAAFQKIVGVYRWLCSRCVNVDATLFTNHALTGFVTGDFDVFGSMVARDDGLVYGEDMGIKHDIRLFDANQGGLVLPYSLKRPRLVKWEECPASGCPDP